jgi:glycosyltransferase involved in cell wall biosynthesis
VRVALTTDPELPVPPLHYGGIERIVDMLARNLTKRGHDVTLFAHPQSSCPVQRIGWPGASSASRLDTLRNAGKLTRHMAAGGFDIVHSFSRIAYLSPLLPLPIPKLMSYQREISPRTTRAAYWLSRGTLEFSAISRNMIERSKLAGTWHLVPNGVPLETYQFRASVDREAPLVFLGRIEEIKGPHLAIEIARRTGFRLVLAGNVPNAHRGWFGRHVAPHIDGDRVRYAGPVGDEQKNELLGQARALLMPILWEEPFGIVMTEAMACGTPVIGLHRGAVPEVVDDGVTGFVRDTVDGMVEAVARAAGIDRAACRARVEKLYSGGAVTEGYLAIYKRMIRGPTAAQCEPSLAAF